MLLSRRHVSAWRIAPVLDKAVTVAELAAELRIGTDSVMLIDDNPAECAAVRAALPTTPCWCLGRVRMTVLVAPQSALQAEPRRCGAASYTRIPRWRLARVLWHATLL